MSYTAVANIQAEFKDVTFSSTTAVTTTDLAQFIIDADAEINSKLSVKYLTPITGTESLVMMGMIAVWLIKDRILEIIAVKSGLTKADQSGGSKSYRQKALDLLASLATGKSKLTDASLATTADGVTSYSSTHCDSVENVFKIGTTQW